MNFRRTMIGAATGLFLFYLLLLLALFSQIQGKKGLEILIHPGTLFSIRLSLMAATGATFLAVLIGLPAGYALSRFEFRGKRVLDTFLEIPMIMSPVALGASLLLFFNTPVGELIQKRGVFFVFDVPGIILAQFSTIAGLATRLMKTSLDEISPRYEAVARSLGASPWRAFYQITLPLSLKGLIASVILCWAKAMGEFGATVTLAGAMPGKTETMPIAIFMSLASADIDKTIVLILILVLLGLGALYGVHMTGKRKKYD
ncbi:MAG: ABC transporter permease [Deltaproteobacteria bacterium RBG_16_48_10]|nr:MAG: ABC transporter permease [Deltaproteobacteria bacterium RBG_16_48_10]